MDALLWNLRRADGLGVLGALWRPFLIGTILYFSGYWVVWLSTLARAAGWLRYRPLDAAPDCLVVIPTLLRQRGDLESLHDAAATVIGQRYPGRVVLCMAIDGSDEQPALLDELERWCGARRPPRVTLLVARVARRAGKGVAVCAGIERVEAAVHAGALTAMPPVFLNMDADSVLGPQALERMVAKLIRPGRWTRRRPMIVASNVHVRRAHYWNGLASLFTMRYQIALQVAREYMTSISVARANFGLFPVTSVSGALYCTWTALHLHQPRYAAFLQSLGRRDVLAWWLGRRPPRYADFTGAPNIAATAGPGDDTWVAWLAMLARWRDGEIDLELPPTPVHALGRLVASFVVRPVAYDPLARVFTATPTTVRALFKQRVRWNSSRPWLVHRFSPIPYFAWHLGAWIGLDVCLLVAFNAMALVALLGWPFAERPAAWLAVTASGYLVLLVIRGSATLLAIVQDRDLGGQWLKLLALPLAGPFHLVFNIATTIVGILQDYLGFGVNTGFAPEETLRASRSGRVALAYRMCRCAHLVARALRHGDVPAGWFWFGWGRTAWTDDGYTGWTQGPHRGWRGGVLAAEPTSRARGAPVPRGPVAGTPRGRRWPSWRG